MFFTHLTDAKFSPTRSKLGAMEYSRFDVRIIPLSL